MKAAPTSNTMFGFLGDPLFQFLKSGWKPKQTRRSMTVRRGGWAIDFSMRVSNFRIATCLRHAAQKMTEKNLYSDIKYKKSF
jgi:hypothetical protein